MTYTNEYLLGPRTHGYNQEESAAFVLSVLAVVALAAGYYILATRFHIRVGQLIELSLYALSAFVAAVSLAWYLATLRRRREEHWPHPPLFVSQAKDRQAVAAAYTQNSIVLGYDVHSQPRFWSDATRVMQSVVFGATGSGKTT